MQVEELGLGHSATNAGTWKVNYEFGEYDPNSQTVTGSKNTGNIARQTVSFDGLPNAFVQTYQYDSLYRLTDANEMAGSSENWSEKFTYDRYGNRDKKFRNGLEITNNALSHPSIDPNTNRFTTTGYGYDKVGNLVTDAEGRNFTFDGNNKQRIVYDGNQTVGEYFYDGDGMRVKKKVYSNGTHTKTVVFVYSGGKLVEEYSTEAPPTDKKIKYLTKDHLGTPRIITDGNGAVVSRRDFMPFGEEIANNVGTRSTSSFKYSANEDDVRQKFTGYQQDSETNLDFAEARMYENRHARFTAVDPLLASGKSTNPQTFNRFIYVGNNPMLRADPNGEDWRVIKIKRKEKYKVYKRYRIKNRRGKRKYRTYYETRERIVTVSRPEYVERLSVSKGEERASNIWRVDNEKEKGWQALHPTKKLSSKIFKNKDEAQKAYNKWLEDDKKFEEEQNKLIESQSSDNGGYVDLNFTNTPGIGFTGGIVVDRKRDVFVYFGSSVGIDVGPTLNFGDGKVSEGPTVQLQGSPGLITGGFVFTKQPDTSLSESIDSGSLELGVGAKPPSASINVFYNFCVTCPRREEEE